MFKFLEKRRWLSWLIVFVIASAIFYSSSISFQNYTKINSVYSIGYHFLAFFLLAFFLSVALIKGKKKNLFATSIILAVAYALSDEFHQIFVPYRSFSFSDLVLDTAAIFLANAIYFSYLEK